METIVSFIAVPFNPPCYDKENVTEFKEDGSIVNIGDIIARELQDETSPSSQFLSSLRIPTHQQLDFPQMCSVRIKSEHSQENSGIVNTSDEYTMKDEFDHKEDISRNIFDHHINVISSDLLHRQNRNAIKNHMRTGQNKR